MKSILAYAALLMGLGDLNGWAADQTFNSALDNRLTVWIGAEFFQADGEFSSTREDLPDIDLDLEISATIKAGGLE